MEEEKAKQFPDSMQKLHSAYNTVIEAATFEFVLEQLQQLKLGDIQHKKLICNN